MCYCSLNQGPRGVKKMAGEMIRRALSEDEILSAVRWRFRICGYLFRLSFAWLFASLAFAFVLNSHGSGPAEDASWFAMTLVSVAIFSAAFVLTLAIYRCPVCDKYLSRFRPHEELCPSCGAKIREAK